VTCYLGRCFTRLLPESTQVFTPYGATEALPVANIGSREILGETRKLTEQGKGVCVGRPVARMEVHVIRMSDQPIPEWDEALRVPPGEVGEFVVRGSVVTPQYFNRPEATALAKIRDPKTGEVLHRMGDVGYLDETGRVWFCGRKSHRVVTPWGTLFTDMVEPIFNVVPGVARTALVGVTRDGVTHPIICFELAKLGPEYRGLIVDFREVGVARLMQEQALLFPHTRHIDTFLWCGVLPVDARHNSKILREELAVLADRRLGKTWSPGLQAPGWPGDKI
jgi:olefin beta-lactone synthetase